jgi:long-subunit fatty acid transport protein
VAGLAAGPAAAQAPIEIPDVPPDEVDFEGFTSLALGSGARAFGMGGAFLARADDATAASWNPAGLSYLRRPEFSIVGARNSFSRGPANTQPTDEFVGYTPDFIAFTYPLSSGAIQLSYQRVFSFRGDRTIRRGNTRFFTEGDGGYDVVTLGSGWRLGRSVRAGASINRWVNGYSQRRDRTTITDAGRPERGSTEQDIDYDLNSGINFNLGLMWTPLESLNVGAVGKTPFTAILNLRRFRQDTPTDPGETVTTNAAERSDVLIDFPGAVGVGASWRPTSLLTLSADYTWTFWSEGRIRNFFRLDATPQSGVPPPPTDYRELPYPTLDDPDQTDTQQFRVGLEYVVIAGPLKIPIRGGVFTDRQYFRAQDGTPPRFWGVAAGTGLSFGPLMIDVAYLRERGTFVPADESAAEVTTRFSRLFLSVIYRHGQ